MRGVAGLLFVFLGLVMGYLILTGRFPSSGSSGNAPTDAPTDAPTNAPINAPIVPLPSSITQKINKDFGTKQQPPTKGPTNKQGFPTGYGDGGNSLGLPTMSHLNDVAASHGGMK